MAREQEWSRMLKWIRPGAKHTSRALAEAAASSDTHQAVLGETVIYFAHTAPTAKRINLGKAAKQLLDTELTVSAAWPSDESARVPPSLEAIERKLEQAHRFRAWADSLNGPWSLAKGVFAHPITAFQVLRLTGGPHGEIPVEDENTASAEDALVEAKEILLEAQKVTIAEKAIDAELFWSEDADACVRMFLRTTEHSIRIGNKDHTIALEPRLLLHRDGIVQITVGVYLPAGCSPADVIDASFPASPLIRSSRIPEPYALSRDKWAGGEWADELEGGVRVRVLEHEEPTSINDWFELAVDRIMRGIGALPEGSWYTYPVIMTSGGDCCADWADNHAHDIVHLTIRAIPRDEERTTLDAGPDLSMHTGMRIHATGGSALILHLYAWRAGIRDLHHTLLYERIGLTYVRLRRLEQRISDFRTEKRDVLRSYRSVLELEKEVRGAYYRAGTARDISRHVLTALGAFETLDVVRHGTSMLGERASTRASVRGARAANRLALLGITVAVFAAVPAIPSILELINQQREAHPNESFWAVIQTLATSPLLLSALVLTGAAVYGLLQTLVLAFRVARYLASRRKRGYASRLGGYELTVRDPSDDER